MDELQSPSSNKKRKFATTDSLLGQRRRLPKRTKIAKDLAGTSKASSNNSPVTSSSRTTSGSPHKNGKPGPSQSRDHTTPIRMSSRVPRPTSKKKALLLEMESRSPESDGTPPLSIISPPLPPSLKRKQSRSSPMSWFAENITPSKIKWLDPNPIELTSDGDGTRTQPPPKRVKRTRKKPLSSEVIDLYSDSELEDVISSPRRAHTRDEGSIVVILSTDEERDPGHPPFSRSNFGETDTRKSPAPSPLGDVSPPIVDKSVFQASPSSHAPNTPTPRPRAPVDEGGVADENNTFTEKADLPRGSLQALYNKALARCSQEPQYVKNIAVQPSPFSSLKYIPPVPVIRYSTQGQSPTLHTPLFFDRIIFRLKPPKDLDVNAFSDDTSLASMEAFKLNGEQEDIQTRPDTVVEPSFIDREALEVATKPILVPPIDFQDDALHIPTSIVVNNLDIPVSKVPKSPSCLANQEGSLPPETVIFKDTPVPQSIEAEGVSANRGTPTPDRAKLFARAADTSPNALSNILSSIQSKLYVVNCQIEPPREAENLLFKTEVCPDQVATIEPCVLKDAQSLVQVLRQRYDALRIPGSTDRATAAKASLANLGNEDISTASECLSESPMTLTGHTMTRYLSSLAASNTKHASSTSESSETPMIVLAKQETTPNLSSLTVSSTDSASSGSELPTILREHVTDPKLSFLAGSLSSRDSSPSTRSRQSSNSSTSIESVNCHLVTPHDSPSPLTPPVKAQKQKPLIHSNPSSSPIVVSFFDMDLSELNLRTLMGNSKFDEDDDDDDISVSGMEFVYPEEISQHII